MEGMQRGTLMSTTVPETIYYLFNMISIVASGMIMTISTRMPPLSTTDQSSSLLAQATMSRGSGITQS